MTDSKQQNYGMFALYSASFLWGLSFIAQKILVDQGVQPFTMVFLRMSFTIVLIGLALRKNISWSTVKNGAVMGLFLYFVFSSQTFGLKTLDSSVSAFITSLNLILIPIFNRLIFKSEFTFVNVISIVLALVGVYFFNITADFKFELSIGMIATLFCAVACAVQIIYGNHFLKKEDPMQLTFVQNLFCALYALISALLFEGGIQAFPRVWTSTSILAIFYIGLVASSLCFLLMLYGQKQVPDPIKVGLIMALQPLFTIVASYFILGEHLTLFKWFGVFFVIGAIAVDEIQQLWRSK